MFVFMVPLPKLVDLERLFHSHWSRAGPRRHGVGFPCVDDPCRRRVTLRARHAPEAIVLTHVHGVGESERPRPGAARTPERRGW
jgi:hypothetical protein